MQIRIRRASGHDLLAGWKLISQPESGWALPTPRGLSLDGLRHLARIWHRTSGVLVAREGGTCLGILAWSSLAENRYQGYLVTLAILPGREHEGISEALLGQARIAMIRAGVVEVEATVLAKGLALPALRSAGYLEPTARLLIGNENAGTNPEPEEGEPEEGGSEEGWSEEGGERDPAARVRLVAKLEPLPWALETLRLASLRVLVVALFLSSFALAGLTSLQTLILASLALGALPATLAEVWARSRPLPPILFGLAASALSLALGVAWTFNLVAISAGGWLHTDTISEKAFLWLGGTLWGPLWVMAGVVGTPILRSLHERFAAALVGVLLAIALMPFGVVFAPSPDGYALGMVGFCLCPLPFVMAFGFFLGLLVRLADFVREEVPVSVRAL